MNPSIKTRSGVYIDFLDTSKNEYLIEDISESLSNLCRFNGHTNGFYSVAQHCYICSLNVPEEYQLEALLHDATEAYLGDVSSPLKKLLPEYKKIEKKHYKAIANVFGIPEETSDVVHHIDLVLLATEKRDLMNTGKDDVIWSVLEGIEPLKTKINPLPPERASWLFYKRFMELKNR